MLKTCAIMREGVPFCICKLLCNSCHRKQFVV